MTTSARREDEEGEQTPNKKTKITHSQQQEVDRISQLPDDILHPILSLLTLKEACITTALSKRWRTLFPTLPRLDFGHSFLLSSPHDRGVFGTYCWLPHDRGVVGTYYWFKSLRDVVESRRAPIRICTISLGDFYDYDHFSDFDNIIRFLCNDGVQELTLNNIEARGLYTIPSCLYFCPTLTRIELCYCLLKVPLKFSLPRRLNTLKLTECLFEDGDCEMQRLILGCRALERLTLDHCHGFRNLAVDAPNLALLDVTTHMPLAVSIVNAPRLESVTVRFIFTYGLDGCSCTDNEGDDTGVGGGIDDEGECSRLVGLLESLGNIQNLWLEKDTRLKGLAVPVTLQSLLPKMKRLTLIMRPNDKLMLSVVSCLLNSCPNLEDLVIGDSDFYQRRDHMYPKASMLNYWDRQIPSDCIRNSLSTSTMVLNVRGYWEFWIELAKFLLNNACLLKNLVFDCHHEDLGLYVLKDLYKKMFLVRPASPYVVIEIKTATRRMFYRPAQITFSAR